MRNAIRIKMLLATVCSISMCVGQLANGQQPPLADLAVKHDGTGIPRGGPRGFGRGNLYDDLNRTQTPKLDVEKLLEEDDAFGGGPLRVGIVQALVVSSADQGRWTELERGAWLWTMAFKAPGARAIRLRIRPWKPPSGADLHIYNAADPTESFGPLTAEYPASDDELWTPIIFADEVRLEYYLPPGVDHEAPASQVEVDGLLNHYALVPSGGGVGTPTCCQVDATCSFPAWQVQANGVAVIFLTGDGLGFICSGGMLNRVDGAEDFTPLFFTATHCGVNQGNVANMVVVWGFQSQTCNGAVPAWGTLNQTPGATVLVRDVTTDWTLVGLNTIGEVPGGTTYLGWGSGVLANGASVTGIHHPRGSFKRISFGTKGSNDGSRPNPAGGNSCVSGSAYRVSWNNGLIERGSSGSPIMDSSGAVRGTLSCGNNPPNCSGTPACSGSGNMGTYGRLDQAYDLLAPWLNPVDPIFVKGEFGGTEQGTSTNPFNTVTEGVYAVIGGSNVFIQSGAYKETITIDKPMTLNAQPPGSVVTIGG